MKSIHNSVHFISEVSSLPVVYAKVCTISLSTNYWFVTMVNFYNYHKSGHCPSSYLLLETQLSSIGLSVPHRKYIMSPLRAQQFYAIYRFVTMVYQYNYHNSGHYPSSCILFKTQLNSIGLSVPHRKLITSPQRDQQVNAIYRFATMVY
jgi:hypothetical protein